MATSRKQLADQLKDARIKAGFATQAALARELTLARPVISKAENHQYPPPTAAVVTAWAKVTRVAVDPLLDLIDRCKSGTPDWFMPYATAEAAATSLRFWGPLLVPGLLQTEAYATEVLSIEGNTGNRLDELVRARMDRQAILGRTRVVAVVDHTVLQRCLGSAELMAEQCDRLVKLAEDSVIRIHVVPPGSNIGLYGAFGIASRENHVTVNLTSIRDVTSTDAGLAEECLSAFDDILAAAMPRRNSVDYIRAQAEQWREQGHELA